jgi:hypothetical protein
MRATNAPLVLMHRALDCLSDMTDIESRFTWTTEAPGGWRDIKMAMRTTVYQRRSKPLK